jgi:hypothetical protein
MAITNFIPELWEAAVQEPFYRALRFAQAGVSNSDYEGEIRQRGDTVHRTTLGNPTIRSYDKTTNITVEDVSDDQLTLNIDQGDYFAFRVNDIDRIQAAGDFQSPATRQAGHGLANKQDAYVAQVMADGAATGNKLGAVTVADASDAYDLLVDLATVLDESDAPEEGRWCGITPAFRGLLRKDPRFVATGDSVAAGARLNGQVGEAAGLRLFVSNNAPEGSDSERIIIAGIEPATTVADQLLDTEALRSELRFGDLVRGLHVYGAKVWHEDGLATAEVTIDLGS